MANAFLKKYTEAVLDTKGIRGITMNAPLSPRNTLAKIGLELELEGAGLPASALLGKIKGATTGAGWTAHADGSLRGGVEYVLSKPCLPEEVEGLVTGVYKTMQEIGTKLVLSNRCSTHVHVNVGGKKINEITSILALWTTMEEALINWCGEERQTNHFCLASKDQSKTIDAWDTKLSGKAWELGEGMKYTALNLRPIFDIGSVEFRCMRADTNPEVIIDWAKFCSGLVDYASVRYANPAYLANDLSERRGVGIFMDICRDSGTTPAFAQTVLDIEENADFDRLTMEGFRRAQPIVLGHPWAEWMPLIEEEYVPSPFIKVEKRRDNPGAERARPAPPEWGEIRAAPAPVVAGRPRRPRGPINVRGEPVNVNEPVYFGDGTLAHGDGNGHANHGQVRVRSLRPGRFWNGHDTTDYAFYSTRDGRFDGAERNEDYPWITNRILGEEPEDNE